jgi:probable F420-dependent oxidoreductase
MKVRIGFGLGTTAIRDDAGRGFDAFGELVDALEQHRFDSLWLSERVTGGAIDPIVGMSFAAGRTARLKFGTSVLVLPGRNPVLLAKELASLDVLSGGRLLPAFGLGVVDPGEQQAFGVARSERAAWFDEALPLIRRLWTEDAVDHHGPRFDYDGLTVLPKPVQQPPDVWLGGQSTSELRRVGRLGDGWLPSFSTPADAAAGRAVIEEAAAGAGREIDTEHYGALIPYVHTELPERLVRVLEVRRPGVDPARVVPAGWAALCDLLEEFIAAGFSKFVLVPAQQPRAWRDEIAELATQVLGRAGRPG